MINHIDNTHYFTEQLHNNTQESNITLYLNDSQNSIPMENQVLYFDWSDIKQELAQAVNVNIVQELAFNIYKYFLTIFLRKRIITKKPEVRSFRFYDLYTYIAKRLKVKKKVMLLLNMKKTLNNFWAWIRTQTIYYMSKRAQTLRKYFFKLRDALPGFSDLARAIKFDYTLRFEKPRLPELAKQIRQNLRRLERKKKWLSIQSFFKKVHDPAFKEKSYNKQIAETIGYIKKMHEDIIDHTHIKQLVNHARNSVAYMDLWDKQIPIQFLKTATRFKARLPQYFTNAFQNVKWNAIKLNYFNQKMKATTLLAGSPTIINKNSSNIRIAIDNLKTRYMSKRATDYAYKTIQKKYLPPNQFQKLKRKFKQNRNELFKEVQLVLTFEESKKAQLRSLIYTIDKAKLLAAANVEHSQNYPWIFNFKKQQAETIYAISQKTARCFEYNLARFIETCVKLISGYTSNSSSTPVVGMIKTLKMKINKNILELKRVL